MFNTIIRSNVVHLLPYLTLPYPQACPTEEATNDFGVQHSHRSHERAATVAWRSPCEVRNLPTIFIIGFAAHHLYLRYLHYAKSSSLCRPSASSLAKILGMCRPTTSSPANLQFVLCIGVFNVLRNRSHGFLCKFSFLPDYLCKTGDCVVYCCDS